MPTISPRDKLTATTGAVPRWRSGILGLTLVLGFCAPGRSEVDKKDLEEKAPDRAEGDLGEKKFGELHRSIEEEGQANLKTISELMKKIQGDLNEKQTGEPTQQRQEEVVKKIDDLIEKLLSAQQQSSSSSSQQQQQQQQQQQGSQQQQQGKQQQKNEKMESMKPGQENPQQGQQQQEQQQRKQEPQDSPGPSENNEVSEGQNPPSRARNLMDFLRDSDRWGLLPRKLQDEVHSSTGREFPSEYQDLISKYYKRMADLLSQESSR